MLLFSSSLFLCSYLTPPPGSRIPQAHTFLPPRSTLGFQSLKRVGVGVWAGLVNDGVMTGETLQTAPHPTAWDWDSGDSSLEQLGTNLRSLQRQHFQTYSPSVSRGQKTPRAGRPHGSTDVLSGQVPNDSSEGRRVCES